MQTATTNPKLWSYARACRRLAALMKPEERNADSDAESMAEAVAHLNKAATELIAIAGQRSSRLPNWLVESALTTALGPDCDESVLGDAPTSDHTQVMRATGVLGSTAEIMMFVCLTRGTGTLEIATPVERFELEFVDGDVVHAQSDETPIGERIGDILVEQGAVTREQIEEAGEQRHSGTPLGHSAWQHWLVTERQLQVALEEQIRRQLDRMFSLPPLRFMFWSGPPRPRPAQVRIDAARLILELSAANADLPRAD